MCVIFKLSECSVGLEDAFAVRDQGEYYCDIINIDNVYVVKGRYNY